MLGANVEDLGSEHGQRPRRGVRQLFGGAQVRRVAEGGGNLDGDGQVREPPQRRGDVMATARRNKRTGAWEVRCYAGIDRATGKKRTVRN